MTPRNLAEILLHKADQDMLVLAKWRSDPEIADNILGFHAQQAAEKMLKAVLANRGIDFPFTHRLADLLDLIKENGIAIPGMLEDVRFLTPFAVEFRYEVYDSDDEQVVFEEIYNLLVELHKWVEIIICQ